MLAVLWRLRYKLGFRDVAEMLLDRGYVLTHETVRDWEARFAPLLADSLRAKRRCRTVRDLRRPSDNEADRPRSRLGTPRICMRPRDQSVGHRRRARHRHPHTERLLGRNDRHTCCDKSDPA